MPKQPEASEESPSPEEEPAAGDAEPTENGEEKADYEAWEEKEGKSTEKKDSTAKKRRKDRKRNNKQMITETPSPSSADIEDQPEPELSSSDPESDDAPRLQPVVANSGECPSDRESVTCNLSSDEEQEPSVAPPRPPSTDEPLLDAPRTLAALSVLATKDLNGLAESRTELATASNEPSLMHPAGLQPQASSPEASSETVPPDMRPQVAFPALLPDFDPRRTLESSTAKKRRKGRKRNNKQMITETPSPSSADNEDQPEPELSSSDPE
ncbi:translation initiation factor IF-2-like [Pleuronectes platessa]|uniref:translation initiation factor IF-2-like n=1 Tax=Pleuronectes platessa TaxID=8262 RepID=UPI00232A239F|nr:translation initiation factor IF-2-like [Pleuronectes platessa]